MGLIDFRILESNGNIGTGFKMPYTLKQNDTLTQIAEDIKIGRQLKISTQEVLQIIMAGNRIKNANDIKKGTTINLGVLEGNYKLFLNVTPEIERVVKENVRTVKSDITLSGFNTWFWEVWPSSSIDRTKYNLDSKEGIKKFNDFVKQKYIGQWDYKRTHPIFSKVQQSTIRYSKHFVYDKAPKKIIRYDFLGNYNYAVTGMSVMGLWDSAEAFIVKLANEIIGGRNDAGDREAVALGIKNYRQYS